MSWIRAISTAVPQKSLSQEELLQALKQTKNWSDLRESSKILLERVLGGGRSGIAKRHFAVCDLADLGNADGGRLAQIFEREAASLAVKATEGVLQNGHCTPGELDALVVCTCTGYVCPGLSSHVAERLALRGDIHLVDLVGQGCGAALPALRQGIALLGLGCRYVAVVAVEICSAAFYIDDDAGVLISFCLFGDGAGACLLSDQPECSLANLTDFDSLHWPWARDQLRFVNQGGKLCNILRPEVPEIAASAVQTLLNGKLQDGESLLLHPGGRKVIEALQRKFPDQDLELSRNVLRDFGNMSSPSVLFVLEQWLKDSLPRTEGWLCSFGAGFTAYCARVSRSLL